MRERDRLINHNNLLTIYLQVSGVGGGMGRKVNWTLATLNFDFNATLRQPALRHCLAWVHLPPQLPTSLPCPQSQTTPSLTCLHDDDDAPVAVQPASTSPSPLPPLSQSLSFQRLRQIYRFFQPPAASRHICLYLYWHCHCRLSLWHAALCYFLLFPVSPLTHKYFKYSLITTNFQRNRNCRNRLKKKRAFEKLPIVCVFVLWVRIFVFVLVSVCGCVCVRQACHPTRKGEHSWWPLPNNK